MVGAEQRRAGGAVETGPGVAVVDNGVAGGACVSGIAGTGDGDAVAGTGAVSASGIHDQARCGVDGEDVEGAVVEGLTGGAVEARNTDTGVVGAGAAVEARTRG